MQPHYGNVPQQQQHPNYYPQQQQQHRPLFNPLQGQLSHAGQGVGQGGILTRTQKTTQPYNEPPPEVVTVNSMPPAYRQAMMARMQAEKEAAQNKAVDWKPRPKNPKEAVEWKPRSRVETLAASPQQQPQNQPLTERVVVEWRPRQNVQNTAPHIVRPPNPSPRIVEPDAEYPPLMTFEMPPELKSAVTETRVEEENVKAKDEEAEGGAPLVTLKKDDDWAIGIDLGTTFSCVGVFRNGAVEIICNDFGNRTTPSCVAFLANGERLVGEAAVSQAAGNATRTIFDAKRLIGRKLEDSTIQGDLCHFPFRVVASDEGNACVAIDDDNVKTPEEISAMVLAKMKSIAEAHLGCPVRKAVITVPAYFNDSQRQATKDAGAIAGLEVLRIINEPTAAAIAYGLDKKLADANILIFDLGGGTFDVSILNLSGGIFTVLATGGNTHLGGEDFDNRFVTHVLKMAKVDETTLTSKNMRRVRASCERAKRALSAAKTTLVEVDAIELNVEVSRAQFEEWNRDLFDQCLESVRAVLRDANLERAQINEVVFVGGSTRIPKVQEMVKQFFQGKEPNRSINPDEAVAYGAAVQAAILAGHAGEARDHCLLMDVAPLSLGVETAGGIMSVLVPRNTTIPCLKTSQFSTYRDDQNTVLVSVFEGERQLCTDNNLLGTFHLKGIPTPSKAGVPQIEVTFEVDVDGILHVSAVETSSKVQNYIDIKSESGRLTQERIVELVAEAEAMKAADEAKVVQVEARNDLEHFLNEVTQSLQSEEMTSKLSDDDRRVMAEHIANVASRLTSHSNTNGHATVGTDYGGWKKELETALAPLLGKLYAQTGIVPGQVNATLDGNEIDEE